MVKQERYLGTAAGGSNQSVKRWQLEMPLRGRRPCSAELRVERSPALFCGAAG